jgi:hypothetical protein
MGTDQQFYLGKFFDLKNGALTNDPLFYDPPDLTTHAIVTGMTGSGKTGLCIGLIEEAALKGIPAILVDPKGDLTNLMLTFPELLPSDFEPWIDPNSARRENKTVTQAAESTAAMWKKGLADWGLEKKNLQALKDAVDRVIYTPGSSTGIPVSIMASFEAPDMPWDENEEVLREKIAATVTALLTLVGMKDIDPLRSREHILLSNIIEYNWKNGSQLDLTGLIIQTQDPPFDKLGAFPLNNFFPQKDRGELAMLLNNFLASPSFQSWIEGQPLDIQSMLYTKDGRPRHSIFYLAHLADAERMFFITLLYSAVETWMRKQRGTGDLRALVYFDEIHGYLPPVANPPSKPLIVRLLKTARAFGVGLVLTTQNPVDVDYKALSNAGTWMVGRLQTDQDKQRLLDGLESAAGGIKRAEVDKLISALGKRVFLYHNVNEKQPEVFQTRWAMSYLAGPMTLTQIPELNKLAGVKDLAEVHTNLGRNTPTATVRMAGSASAEKPKVGGVSEYYLPSTDQNKETTFKAALLAIAEVRYLKQNPSVDYKRSIYTVVESPRETGQMWENFIANDLDPRNLLNSAPGGAKFGGLPEFMSNSSWWTGQEREFEQWIFETDTVSVRSCGALDVSAGPEISDGEFINLCKAAAEAKSAAETKKLENTYATKTTALEHKVETQNLQVQRYRQQMTTRGLDTALKIGESLFKFATKGRITGVSSSSSKVRMTADANTRLKEAETVLENYQEDLKSLQANLESEKQALQDKWLAEAENITEVKLTPTKQNIRITHFGIGWKP